MFFGIPFFGSTPCRFGPSNIGLEPSRLCLV